MKSVRELRGRALPAFTEWGDLDLNYKVVAHVDAAKCIGCNLCCVACRDSSVTCIHNAADPLAAGHEAPTRDAAIAGRARARCPHRVGRRDRVHRLQPVRRGVPGAGLHHDDRCHQRPPVRVVERPHRERHGDGPRRPRGLAQDPPVTIVSARTSIHRFVALLMGLAVGAGQASAAPTALDSARVVFQRNVDAIRDQNLEAYLGCYLPTDTLVRTGPTGFTLGYKSLAESAGSWPTVYEAHDLRLTPVRDGVVYGTYRYRVRFGEVEHAGISERLFVRTHAGWKVAMTTAFDAPPGTPPPPRAIVGATLIDGTGATPVRDAVVIMRDGKIEAAGPRRSTPIPAGIDTLDARGTWVLPGLADAHVHFSQTGWVDGRPDALDLRDLHPYEATVERLRSHPEMFFRSWLASGVTSVFDVGGFAWTVGLQERTRLDTETPRVVAAGPLLSTLDHWLNLPAERQFMYLTGDSIARAGVQYLKSLGASAVKVWFIMTPGRDFDAMAQAVAAAGDEARRVGLPLIVHATGLREAKAALRARPHLLVHSVWDVPVDQEFLDLARAAGTIYCPTLTVIEGYWRLDDAMRSATEPPVDDPHRAVDSLTRAHVVSTAKLGARDPNRRTTPDSLRKALVRTMAANLLKVHKAGIPVAMGTDAGNPLTLHGPSVYAEMEAMQRAGMSPMDVIVASTRNAIRAMGRGEALGTIAPGRLADLIIVGADPTKDVANLRRLRWVGRDGVLRPAAEFKARN